jgi:phosphate-selective porin OprO/OprP
MARMRWRTLILGALLSAGAAPVMADDLADLKSRLDAIEQENDQLRSDLEAMKKSDEEIVGQMSQLDKEVDGKADKKADDPLSMSAKWNHGFEAASKDKRFKFHVGGRIQLDAVFLQNDPAFYAGTGPFTDQDSVNFRRARLRADGTMYETIDWCAEFDFVNSVNVDQGYPNVVPAIPAAPASESNIDHVTAPTDLWVTFREVPVVGNIRVGNVKEPIGMEHLHSSRYLDFMERSYNQDAFYGPANNGFTPGVLAFDNWADEHGTWATGVFKNTTNAFAYGIGEGEYAWTSRLTYLPWYEDEGRRLAHLGISGSIRDPNNHTQRYRARGSLRNGPGGVNPVLANTGNFSSDETDMLNFESAIQLDRLLMEAEYCVAQDQNTPIGDTTVYGYYVQALYFLTEDHREYEKKQGVFGRVVPHHNLGDCGGLGAWQVGARYSKLDLVDGLMDGGTLEDVTLGLNWFLNPNLKIQNNYIYTVRDAQLGLGGGDSYGFGTRLAWDF